MYNLTAGQEKLVKRAEKMGIDVQIVLDNLHLSDNSLGVIIKVLGKEVPPEIVKLVLKEKSPAYLNSLGEMALICYNDWDWFSLDYSTTHFRYFANHPTNWKDFLDPEISVADFKLLELYLRKGLDKDFIKLVIKTCNNYNKTEVLLQAKLEGLEMLDLLNSPLTTGKCKDILEMRRKGIDMLKYPNYVEKGFNKLLDKLDLFTIEELEKAFSYDLSINKIFVCNKILRELGVDMYGQAKDCTDKHLQGEAEMIAYERKNGVIETKGIKVEQSVSWKEQGRFSYQRSYKKKK